MWAFDASSMIYAWDNYPFKQFPGLWSWLGDQVSRGIVVVPLVAYDEITHKTPDCGQWLSERGVSVLHPTTAKLQAAARIKALLEIDGDRYGGGVGENDLIIISSADCNGLVLVSNEKLQISLPKLKSNYKIPAVCTLKKPPLVCIDFLEFMRRSNAIF